MNNEEKDYTAAFSSYARLLLEEQETQLKNMQNNYLLSGKLSRIKIFNEHLDILKEKLQQKMDVTLASSGALSPDQHDELVSVLKVIFSECINEYLCSSFIKENG